MVDFHHERNAVGVLTRATAEHSEGRSHGIAAAFDREANDVFGIKVRWILGETCAGTVFNALIDGQDAQEAGVGQAPRTIHLLQAPKNLRIAVRRNEDAIHKVCGRQVQHVLADGLARVAKEGVGVRAEDRYEV